MGMMRKLKRILEAAFPPPSTISLRDVDGIIGVVTSSRFRRMGQMDRQLLLDQILQDAGLTKEELRRIVIIVAVTPEEEEAHTAMDRLGG